MHTLRLNQRGIIRTAQIGMAALLLALLVRPPANVSARSTQQTIPVAYHQSAQATDDVTIRRAQDGSIIGDMIWQSNGSGSTTVNEPIADAILSPVTAASSTGPGAFTYTYTLNTPNETHAVPKVKVSWQVHDPQEPTRVFASGMGNYQTGWTNAFRVTMPNAVGKYTLAVTFAVAFSDVQRKWPQWLHTQHTLYVLLHPPIPTEYRPSWATDTPNTRWLDYATTWAAGAQSDAAVLAGLNATIYSNPLNWRYLALSDGLSTGPALLSGSATGGNCINFTEVLQILASTHGIPASREQYRPDFLAPAERPPLSGRPAENQDGNARNTQTLQRDRWTTGLHAFLVYDGRYYEPTFGFSGVYVADDVNPDLGFGENVYCHITSDGSCIKGGTLRARVSGYGQETNSNGWYIRDYTPR